MREAPVLLQSTAAPPAFRFSYLLFFVPRLLRLPTKPVLPTAGGRTATDVDLGLPATMMSGVVTGGGSCYCGPDGRLEEDGVVAVGAVGVAQVGGVVLWASS